MSSISLLFFISFSFWVTPASASTCCGGGIAAPALISGDDRAQITLSAGQLMITDDVYSDGTWRSRNSNEIAQTWTLEAAHIFKDRWQTGVSLPMIKRERLDSSSTGVGDLTGNIGYEYLPDWDYNPYRPRGLGFVQIISPLGRPVFESREAYQLDTRGRGFWAFGAGTLLTKVWGQIDAMTVLSVHRSLARGDLRPGWGGSFGLGAGYSRGALRLGGSLNWTYEDPIDRSGPLRSKGSSQRYSTATLSLSYTHSELWSGSVAYLDQTLFGVPVNTNLGRGVQLQLQRHFSR